MLPFSATPSIYEQGQHLFDSINKSWAEATIQSKIHVDTWPVRRHPASSPGPGSDHEDIIGNLPFALDFILARRSESESRIVLCVAHDNDEWIACIFDFPIPRFDQFSANSPVAGIPALRPSDPKATP